MAEPLSLWSIDAIRHAYETKETSPTEVARITLDRIQRLDGELHSFVSLDPDLVLDQAATAEKEMLADGPRSLLHGIPISFKDLIDVEGLSTTGSSRVYKDRRPGIDAEAVSRLRRAGAVILGVNTAYEFGLGLPMAGDWPEPARNPWDPDRIPGGSSSGSAVSVFSGMSWGSLGTDTGGSIRGPASYCGVVGFKPTYGWISADGVMALSETLDHVGPLTRTIGDAAHLLEGSSGRDVDLMPGTAESARVGVPRSLIDSATIAEDVVVAFDDTLRFLEQIGATVIEIELPPTDATENALLTIIGCEGYANHRANLTKVPELYGSSARERLSSGAGYSGADYVEARKAMAAAARQLADIFETVDFVISPVTHTTAPTFAAYAAAPTPRTLFTGIYNLAGAPSVSVPCGTDSLGLPIGVLVSGPPGTDARVLSMALPIEERFAGEPLTPSALRFRR